MAAEKNISSDEDYIATIKELVNKTKYGSINLIIQDGKVIQIDRTEKIRLKN